MDEGGRVSVCSRSMWNSMERFSSFFFFSKAQYLFYDKSQSLVNFFFRHDPRKSSIYFAPVVPPFRCFVNIAFCLSVSVVYSFMSSLFFLYHDTLFFCFSPVISSGKMEQESWNSAQVEGKEEREGGGGNVEVSLRKTGWRGGEMGVSRAL